MESWKKFPSTFLRNTFFSYVWHKRLLSPWQPASWAAILLSLSLMSNKRPVALKVYSAACWQQVIINIYFYTDTKYERVFFSDMLMRSAIPHPNKNLNNKTYFPGMLQLLFLLLCCLLFWNKQWRVDNFLDIVTQWLISTGWVYLFMFFFLPEEFQSFVGSLPTHYAVNTSVVEHLWRTDASLLQRYRQLETSSNQLLTKARRAANKLFSLSKRCRKQPRIVLQRPR